MIANMYRSWFRGVYFTVVVAVADYGVCTDGNVIFNDDFFVCNNAYSGKSAMIAYYDFCVRFSCLYDAWMVDAAKIESA